jgi:hypothetical protein
MRKIVIIFFLGFISVVAKSQAAWETRFVFEFWRDDTTEFLIYDTLTIGLDKDGDVGFQLGLDQYVDSTDEFYAFFVDSIFYTEFQHKKLKKDIRKFPDRAGMTEFKSFINRRPRAIFYDTNTLQLYIPPYLTSIWGQGPKGSSIGTWDYNSITLLNYNRLPRYKIPCEYFYQIPQKFYFSFTVHITDSLKIGTIEQAQEPNISMQIKDNSLLISSPKPINHGQIEIRDMTGKMVFNQSNLLIESTAEIPMDALASGVYFATIYTGQSYLIKKLFKP